MVALVLNAFEVPLEKGVPDPTSPTGAKAFRSLATTQR